MPRSLSRPRLLPALATALVLLTAGCGDDSPTAVRPDPDGLPPITPENDSPANTLLRFEATYEHQVVDEYAKLFATDFTFLFSSETDPVLVAEYGEDWGKADDRISTQHLFDGFTNDLGDVFPGATVVSMSLRGTTWSDDPDHADSTDHYRLAVIDTAVLQVDVPMSPDTLTWRISARQRFSLVRGDAALLDSGQVGDASRWYIRRWADLATFEFGLAPSSSIPIGAPRAARNLPSEMTTWGLLKAVYR